MSTILLVGCTQSDIVEKPKRTITIEIANSEVVLLDGKEIHVSLLKEQVANLAQSYQLTSELKIAADAKLGIINDVQQAVLQHSPRISHLEA